MKPIILITGASGFIGSALTKVLAPYYTLIGLSRFKPPPDPRIQWFQADISRPSELERAFHQMSRMGRIEGMIHLAAHIDLLDRPSEKWETVNVRGTENLLREAVHHQIPFFVYASSIVVMDASKGISFLDESAGRKAHLRYAVSKMRAEEVVERYADHLKVLILRIGTVYSREPHLSYLNYQIASLFNADFSTRFLPTPLSGGLAYVSLEDTCRAFEKVLEHRNRTRSGEIFVISEEGYLPHAVAFQEIQGSLDGTLPALFPIPVFLAKWGTFLHHLWERLFHPRLHLRPWMAEFGILPFCVDTRKAKRELGWIPRHHVTVHLRHAADDLKADPSRWFRERNLRLKSAWLRGIKKGILKVWDRFLCRLLLDTIKIVRAYLPWKVETLVSNRKTTRTLFNLHRMELPCRIPWQFLLKIVVRSWPTSLVHFVPTRQGYDYRLFGSWSVLHFRKVGERPGILMKYRVTSGFAAGGYQTFSVRQDREKYFVSIDTRVPLGRPFPVRIHNFYTAEHLRNILTNLFSFRLKKGENLLGKET